MKHKSLKFELCFANKFIKFYLKFKFSAVIFKKFSFIHAITSLVLQFCNKYCFNLMTGK